MRGLVGVGVGSDPLVGACGFGQGLGVVKKSGQGTAAVRHVCSVHVGHMYSGQKGVHQEQR